jgi:CAAX protease family protein
MEDDNNNLPDESPEQEQNGEIKPVISPILAGFLAFFVCFILFQVGGSVLTILILGMNPKNYPLNSVRLLESAGEILLILLPALLFTKWNYSDIGKIIRIRSVLWQEVLLFSLGAILLVPILQDLLYIQNYIFNNLANSTTFFHNLKSALDSWDGAVENSYINILATRNFMEKLLVIVIVGIVPAICEESMFRGFIQRSFEMKMKPFWAALIAAFCFGVSHLYPYQLIALTGLGLFFGFAAYTSETIVIPIILHFLNNFMAIIMYFFYGNQELVNNPTISKSDLIPTIGMLVGLTIIFFFIIYFIKRYYSKLKKA